MSGRESNLRILAWEEFCGAYWRPLHKWLRLRGVSNETAEDLVQCLFSKLHASPASISHLDPGKGKLRSFLLASLRNLWIDHIRSCKAARHCDSCNIVLTCEETPDGRDEMIFDREWALAVMQRSVGILREEYTARGNLTLFDSLLVLIENDDSDSREQASAQCGLHGNTFNVALKRLRERLAVRLRCEVAATLIGADDQDIDDELRHLLAILGRGGFGSALINPT